MNSKVLYYIAAFFALVVVLQWLIDPLCETVPSKLSLQIAGLSRDTALKLSYSTAAGQNKTITTVVKVFQPQVPSSVVFHLPADIQPTTLTISLPSFDGNIEIQSIDFGFYHWGPIDIAGSFRMSTDIGKVWVNNESLYIRSIGPNPFFTSAGVLDYVYSRLAIRAVAIRAVVFLMSLLVFLFTIILSTKVKHIDSVSASNMVRMTVFYSTCILLLLPSIFTVLNALNLSRMPVLTTNAANEKKPDPLQFSLKKPADFLRRVDPYFRMTYSFRYLLIRWYCGLNVGALNESPVPICVKGKDGWLYANMYQSLDDMIGLKRLNQYELKNVRARYTNIKKYLDNKGIYFLIVFAPSQATVYPEYLPASLSPLSENTCLDQVINEI